MNMMKMNMNMYMNMNMNKIIKDFTPEVIVPHVLRSRAIFYFLSNENLWFVSANPSFWEATCR